MLSFIRFISRIIVKHPYINLAILFVATLIAIHACLNLKLDTSLSAFVIKDDPDLAYYNKIKDLFQTDETIIIGFKANDLFSKKDLEFIKELSGKIEAIEFVRNVKSLTTTNRTVTTPEMFEVKGLVDKMPETEKESQDIKSIATTNYLYIKDLSSLDGRFGSLLVDIKNNPEKRRTKEVVEAIKHILKEESRKTHYIFYLGGDAIINDSLGEYMQRDAFRFVIPTYIILTILLIITVGRLRDIIIALVNITIALTWAVGSISLFGKTLNNVTVGLLPLIMCLSLEDIYYFHNYYYERLPAFKDKRRAFEDALNNLMRPAFFCSFTTVIGFASLMTNNVKPIFDFGIVGCAAVTISFLTSLLFIPSVHILLKMPKDVERKPRFKLNSKPFFNTLGMFIERNRRYYWVAIPAIITLSVCGIMRIKIETDHMTFFHKNSDVYKATTFIENNLGGVSNLEIIVNTNTNDKIKDPAVLEEIDELVNFIRQQKKVDKVMSIVDFLKDMNRAMYDNDEARYVIPETKEAVAQYLLMYLMSPRRNDIEKDFVDYHYRLARIRCRLSEHNSKKIIELINRIKQFATKNIDPKLEVRITSYPVIYSNMVDSLSHAQIQGLILVTFALLTVTIIYFRSFALGILAILPNCIPILFTFGVMGWTGITLNVGTAMTAGIAIGIAMDDTTYYFTRFIQDFPGKNRDYEKTMKDTLSSLGEPMSYSSLLMVAGYLVLTSSQFHLTVLFGLLCALTIFVALLCDLLITPWIFIAFRPKLK